MITEEKQKKKAILFGGTDGHGITMTAISFKNLEREGYDINLDHDVYCKYVDSLPRGDRNVSKNQIPEDCGTGSPEFFWGHTFLHTSFNDSQLSLIVIVDIPLPIQVNLNFSAADTAIQKIRELCDTGIRIILVDHHKRAITHYNKAIDAGAELIFSIGSEQYCHYGNPDDFSLFWGSRGAICDRDPSQLPLEKDEFCPFEKRERDAEWLDLEKKHSRSLLKKIIADDRNIPRIPNSTLVLESSRNNSVTSIDRLKSWNESQMGGLKQLDLACSLSEIPKTPYGIGINSEGTVIQVINYWKINSLPVALMLPQYRQAFGHDTALNIQVNGRDYEDVKKQMADIVTVLNSQKITKPTISNSQKITKPTISNLESDAIGYIAQIFKDIPIAYNLTKHGWNHVETVLANARLLGYLSSLNEYEQTLLNWSALFHDLGNAAMSYKEKYCPDVQSQKEARDKHEQYTVQILKGMQTDGMFKDIFTDCDLNVICEICLRHRKKSTLPENPELKKLCVLLRISDALDKTKSRARENDAGELYSKIRKKLLCDENIVSIMHWEGQRAIESIRLNITKKRIIFEFLVSDKESAQFIICDFKEELAPLKENISAENVKIIPVSLLIN